MRLLSWLQGTRRSTEVRQAAQAMRRRYGDRAYELASTFVTNAADDGNEVARRHWAAVRTELLRIKVASRTLNESQKAKESKRRVIDWE
jgi:hypothetical protein